jgi:hypothetical protein
LIQGDVIAFGISLPYIQLKVAKNDDGETEVILSELR